MKIVSVKAHTRKGRPVRSHGRKTKLGGVSVTFSKRKQRAPAQRRSIIDRKKSRKKGLGQITRALGRSAKQRKIQNLNAALGQAFPEEKKKDRAAKQKANRQARKKASGVKSAPKRSTEQFHELGDPHSYRSGGSANLAAEERRLRGLSSKAKKNKDLHSFEFYQKKIKENIKAQEDKKRR